ncbi:hypothetical protein KFU94_49725 [Chloroflexi bacterium TSY]|nr:hypothetical protein [Chloroflexi bacterium TSY]
MGDLRCKNLLSIFNAVPYEVPPLPDEMTSFGDEDVLLHVTADVNLDYEVPRDDWQAIATTSTQAFDNRLPRAFVDGAVSSVEIAGSVQDNMGYARSIRAGQMGAGAINLDTPTRSKISCNYVLAATTTGYTSAQIRPLRKELSNQTNPFDLIIWEAASDSYFKSQEERDFAVHDVTVVRNRLRRRITDVMLEREQELVQDLQVPVYVDGRYVDHLPATDDQLVMGVIKSMRRRYLDIPRMQILYNLKVGERTPGFETVAQNTRVVSFYARISSVLGGATNGLVRVELGKAHFENYQQQDWALLNSIAAHLTQLCTKDSAYRLSAVTVEPIKVIEDRIQRLFHPLERVSMRALNVLR